MEVAGVGRAPLKALNLDANATRASSAQEMRKAAAAAAAASTGQILEHDKAVSGGRQKPRLSKSDINLILALKSEACPTPEDSERVALAGRIDAMWNEFRDDVVEQFFTKGYVEVEDGYFAERARSEAWVRDKWATLDFSKFELYHPGDEGLDDFVVRPGEDAEEAIYYVQE